jgi:PAP2 superfamily protein
MTLRHPFAWFSRRHNIAAEAAVVVGLYALYELSRGLVAHDPPAAERHARMIVSLERSLHVFVEGQVQNAAEALPGLTGALGFFYLTLHLMVTGACLIWLHRRRPELFPFVRSTLLLASALALVGYLAFPTAPPRLAAVGIADTISEGHVSLNHGLVSSLYNPFAAVPSMHFGYAIVVGVTLARYGGRPLLRAFGVLYPALVLLVIVATGNHFLFDAAAGAVVAAIAAGVCAIAARRRSADLRDLGPDARALAGRALDSETAVERLDAVGQAADAGAGRIGAADPVVRDFDFCDVPRAA